MSRSIPPIKGGTLPDVNIKIDRFNRGLITLVDQSLLFTNSAKDSTNLMQTMDGRWTPRWGSDYYGVDTGGTLYGAATFTTDAGATHLVVATGTAIKRSTDDGETWDSCSGATITAGNRCFFKQIGSVLYIANGVDNIIQYDGTTTLGVFASISTPSAPSPSKTGLTGTTYTASYKVAAINGVGETAASTAGTVTIGKTRENWTAGSDYITVTWSKVTGATAYNIYYKDDLNGGGTESYLGSVEQPSGSTVTFTDNGEATQPLNTFVVAPSGDTTSGPTFSQMELSGNRLWATLDPDNPWRVYWSGVGSDVGKFSPFSGGGWIDLESGGRERPKNVVHYRDGRGSSYATVLTSDPEGVGSIWQISLDKTTVQNVSFIVASAVKLVGSVGTIAPMSVAKVKDDIMFFNRRGWFNLGSRAQMLNLLSTDEISSNIRPDILALNGSALENTCAYYFNAKVFVSMPGAGSSTNNLVYVNDTERKNWSGPWDVGVERFFEYADTNGDNHLLAVPTSGSRLLEFSETITGDLSTAFTSTYISGLYPIGENRNNWAKIRYAYFELAQPVGRISLSVYGTTKQDGLVQLGSIEINDQNNTSNVGFSSAYFSSFFFSDTSVLPTTTGVASVKKRIRINKLINNIQFKISTTHRGDSYVLMTISAKGFMIPTSDPVTWRT